MQKDIKFYVVYIKIFTNSLSNLNKIKEKKIIVVKTFFL